MKLKAHKRNEEMRRLAEIMLPYLPDIMVRRQFSDAWDSSIWADFMATGQKLHKDTTLKRFMDKTGFRAIRILQVIGDALKIRLCNTDMIFERECEEV